MDPARSFKSIAVLGQYRSVRWKDQRCVHSEARHLHTSSDELHLALLPRDARIIVELGSAEKLGLLSDIDNFAICEPNSRGMRECKRPRRAGRADLRAVFENEAAAFLEQDTAIVGRRFVRSEDERRVLSQASQQDAPSNQLELTLLSRDILALQLSSAQTPWPLGDVEVRAVGQTKPRSMRESD
jgi:hypothetical protein